MRSLRNSSGRRVTSQLLNGRQQKKSSQLRLRRISWLGAVVFAPTDHEVPLNDHYQWWSYVKGANWRHPFGPQSDIKGKENYPVVQIAYPDAEAYAKWAGKRLPTEAEFEFAARGGLSGKTYVWGDEFRPGGKWMANTWQGKFPVKDAGEDGYAGIAPVKSFPPNGYGLYDMAGNVWEWCSDWYRPDYYKTLADKGGVTRNPQGPDSPLDPAEPKRRRDQPVRGPGVADARGQPVAVRVAEPVSVGFALGDRVALTVALALAVVVGRVAVRRAARAPQAVPWQARLLPVPDRVG